MRSEQILCDSAAATRLSPGVGLIRICVMRRFLRQVGLFLVTTGATSCLSGEGECHRRATASLGCCPFCDDSCEVSKNADARAVLDSCLADLGEQQAEQLQDEMAASEGDTGGPQGEDTGESTFPGDW